MEIENLIFEGGGMKGVAYARVPEALKEFGILDNVKKVAGSSAGSIAATLIALKYNPDEIRDIIENMRFNEFKDNYTYSFQIIRMLFTFGINTGEFFTDWIQSRIRFKTGSRYTTFSELFEQTKIELVITGTNMNNGKTEYFSYKTTPDMQVWKAVRISITIPIFFTPIIFQDNLYMDGGILSNYPIWLFDSDDYEMPYNKQKINYRTLGFKLYSRVNKSESKNNPYVIPLLSTVVKLIMMLVNHVDKSYHPEQYKLRTVEIDVTGVNSVEFNLDHSMIDFISKNGYETTKKFLEHRKKVIDFDIHDVDEDNNLELMKEYLDESD